MSMPTSRCCQPGKVLVSQKNLRVVQLFGHHSCLLEAGVDVLIVCEITGNALGYDGEEHFPLHFQKSNTPKLPDIT